MINKVYKNAGDALRDVIKDNLVIMSGGFGICGIPETLIGSIKDAGVHGLTVISNNCGADNYGLWMLLQKHQIKKMIATYVGENKEFLRQYLEGELDLEFCPQGTMAERIRAGGAGVPAFYTKTGVGTVVAEGKEQREFNGETYLMETALNADLSIIKAWKADEEGNLVYRKTARNFNPVMATAGKITIAEVDEIVPCGQIDPDEIHTPGIYVDRVILSTAQKHIEKRTVRERPVAAEV